jgi:hypothetical protein
MAFARHRLEKEGLRYRDMTFDSIGKRSCFRNTSNTSWSTFGVLSGGVESESNQMID